MIRKKKIRWLAVISALCIACTGQAHAGAIQDRIDSTGEKINELEDELNQADQKIDTYEKEQELLEQDISQRQEQISRLSQELDETKASAEKTQDQIEETQAELEQAQEESRTQYEQMKMRICFMYENSMGDMLTYVLEAGSLPEALRRANYFQTIVNYDREKLNEYKATAKKIKKAKEKLVSDKEELEALEAEQSEKIEQIDLAVAELKQRLSSKTAQLQSSQTLRRKYEQELEQQKQYEQELERQKAEEDRRRQEEIKRQEEELRRKQQEEKKRQEEQERRQNSASGSSGSAGSSGGTQGQQTNQSPVSASAGDLELLSTIIYCEAGNQSYEGKLAVGSVIMNRVASSSFPNSISGVIYQSGQFSPVASGRFARALAAGLGKSCRSVAQDVLNGRRNVSCLYFRYNNGLIDGLVIGDHVFY